MNPFFKTYFPIALLFFSSCAEQNSNLGRKALIHPKESGDVTFPSKNTILETNKLKRLETSSVYYQIDNTKDTTLYGSGTIIFIPANCLVRADGIPIEGSVTIELKELYDKASLVLNNKPTISNRNMLVTGGVIYLNAFAKGNPLTISCKDGIGVTIHKTSDYPNMEMFMGNINHQGHLNWVKDSSLSEKKETGSIDPETIYQDGIEGEYKPSFSDKVFSATKFGWINCDAFYEDPRPKVSIAVKLQNELPEDNTTNVFIVFKNINSVLALYSGDKKNYESPLIPEGEDVYLVSISGTGDRYFYDSKSVITQGRMNETLILKEAKANEIIDKVKSLN